MLVVRAPEPIRWLTARTKTQPNLTEECFWGHLGLIKASISVAGSPAPQSVSPDAAGGKLLVWNLNVLHRPAAGSWVDALGDPRPVRLVGMRNGTFAGVFAVGDFRPLRGLSAKPSALAHREKKGSIPAESVELRFVEGGDMLEDAPLAEYAVDPRRGVSFAPVWLRVRVPADATPGEYLGAIRVEAGNAAARDIPVSLYVANWTLPPIGEYHTMMDYIQSPESLAMAYNVPMWSEEHFRLLDRTFGLLNEIGCKTLFITAVRRTHFGNEHAMLRWIADDEGELTPDFSIVEKYLDAAVRRLGRIPAIIFCCWEPAESAGHADLGGGRIWDKKILITVVDPKTGALFPRTGPAWGTPEAAAFWKKATDGFIALLRKRGLEKSLLFGLIGDARPSKQAMDDITAGVDKAAVRWAVHSHFRCENWQGYKIGLGSALWGMGVGFVDPSQGLGFGWNSPKSSQWWLTVCARGFSEGSTPVSVSYTHL
ncbi:MAG: hypothetical protein N3A38_15940, partial [Planctomycetota bacterium]|nr:hypothetical protein [Planctomycetota bacterium]